MKTTLLALSLLAGLLLLMPFAPIAAAESSTVDRVLFKEGKVMVPHDGKMEPTIAEAKLPNEVVVATNGVFTVGKGKPRQLREGQTIDAQGMLSSLDGTVVPVFDHIAARKGQIQVVIDGESRILSGEFALPDGGKVLADGTVRHGGTLKRLLDGQLLRLDGSNVAGTDTATMSGGKVTLFKDGGQLTLRPGQTMTMSDGTKVSSNGTVIRPDGTRVVLKEGETLQLPGVRSSGR